MMRNKKPAQDLAGEPTRLRAAALRYLSRREYSAAELRQRLKERGAAAADIETLLEYLQERGYQDDARAAESHIRQRLNYAPRGRFLVEQELRDRGLNHELIANLLAEQYPPEQEQIVLQRLLAKETRLRRAAPKEGLTTEEEAEEDAQKARRLRQKLLRRLLVKGFNRHAVQEALEEWLPVEDDFSD